ncbi:hypothetical protein HQ308_05360 [Rhodococcus sp. BP-241]|uniref:hypothetical protein n=1 Tax=Rhodococcus sp. BP-241 TaxID=2739441 RepID=UPI001C9A6EFB|nr:hypothetical protein [Rhodococcus sp. BP-241]MBY6706224.1 hypothetical protein [Rhodococcus sp. BP-241]
MKANYVYGDVDGSLIFLRRELADELVSLRSGFATWGEARANLAAKPWEDIKSRFSDAEEDMPRDSEDFDLEAVPGVSDGDWPAWPAALMIQEIPSSVTNEFGSVEDSVFNGQFLQLKSDDEAEIVRALESHGWTCGRDDDLVRKASGY